MIYIKTITLPATMPLDKRISEAAMQLREWVHEYQVEGEYPTDQLRLAGFDEKNGLCHYRYEFFRKENASPSEENDAENNAYP